MDVLKRAYLYDTRKKGKSLTLFLLFVLITVFVTISFSVLSATQAAAANLRETVGASFTLHGKPVEFSADEANFSVQFIPISQQDIDLIAGSTEIKACNAQQSVTAAAGSFILPSGIPKIELPDDGTEYLDITGQYIPYDTSNMVVPDSIEVRVTVEHLLWVYLLGSVLCTAVVTLASVPVVKMKPKNILSQTN